MAAMRLVQAVRGARVVLFVALTLGSACDRRHDVRVVASAPAARDAPEASMGEARSAAEAWLADLDACRYGPLWAESASHLRERVDLPRFESTLEGARAPYRRERSRRPESGRSSLRGGDTPQGPFIELVFATTFESVAEATETLQLVRDADGLWRVAGYQIRSRCAATTARPSSLPPPPATLGLATFYAKYLDAGGIPVVASARVSDRALAGARQIVIQMLRKRPDARARIARARVRVAVMAPDEQTLDVPEHADLAGTPTDTPGVDWNERARGLGATLARPATSCGEENLLCLPCDRYAGENVLVHELGHTIAEIGLADDDAFQHDLRAAFAAANERGLWRGTYAARSVAEYWAEGVQDWFDANADGDVDHVDVHTRARLAAYDPALHALLARVFEDDDWRYSCPATASAFVADLVAGTAAPAKAPSMPAPAMCPRGMAGLPGGSYAGGGVTVRPFCMDVHEVTVAEYDACVRSRRCSPAWTTTMVTGLSSADLAKWSASCNGARRDRSDHPVNCVDWAQSDAYCRAQGKRLPTEDEWEWAATAGGDGRRYPWGSSAPDDQLCWSGRQQAARRDHTCAVGSFVGGDAPGGIHDLAGNVWEWTSSTRQGEHIHRGGGFNAVARSAVDAAAAVDAGGAASRASTLGFRCVE
jgi:hypothetical protein